MSGEFAASLPLPRSRLPAVSSNTVLLAVTTFIVLFDNNRFWSIAQAAVGDGLRGLLLQASTALVLIAGYSTLLSLLPARRLLKPLLVCVVVFSAVTSYFIDQLGVVINVDMVRNVVETNSREAVALLTPALGLHLLLHALLPSAVLVAWPVRQFAAAQELRRRFGMLALLLGAALTLGFVQYKELSMVGRQNKSLGYFINPFYPAKALYKYAHSQLPSKPLAQSPLGRDATRALAPVGAPPKVVVLVLGETARAANFGINGYARDTTPRLAATPELINFGDTVSCGTATAQSVPCMFSLLGRDAWKPEPDQQYLNVLDVLANTGVHLHWLDNDGGCKGVCASAETQDVSRPGSATLCDAAGCHDEILLESLPQLLDTAQGDTLIVLHQMGSHGPNYDHRYPAAFARFTPACGSAEVQYCTREEIVNAYDNTVLYTDHVLGEVLAMLQAHSQRLDTAMIYISDHGESLGENGVYLHGLPYALAPLEQKRVPFVAWLSPQLRTRETLQDRCLRELATQAHSHDNLAPLLLGLFNVRGSAYRAELDPFTACRGPA